MHASSKVREVSTFCPEFCLHVFICVYSFLFFLWCFPSSCAAIESFAFRTVKSDWIDRWDEFIICMNVFLYFRDWWNLDFIVLKLVTKFERIWLTLWNEFRGKDFLLSDLLPRFQVSLCFSSFLSFFIFLKFVTKLNDRSLIFLRSKLVIRTKFNCASIIWYLNFLFSIW